MDMHPDVPEAAAVDAGALAEALCALGLLYGAREALPSAAAGAADEADAVRTFIQRERPHLLASYDARRPGRRSSSPRAHCNARAPASIEQFTRPEAPFPPAARRP